MKSILHRVARIRDAAAHLHACKISEKYSNILIRLIFKSRIKVLNLQQVKNKGSPQLGMPSTIYISNALWHPSITYR